MADAVGILGLTITIIDQLLKLGERTAELASDIRAFDEDTRKLYADIKHEEGQTRSLKRLLFSQSSVYHGQTLFEQFDEDVQDQIREFLLELVSILQEGYNLLQSRYGSSSDSRSHASSLSRIQGGSSSPPTPLSPSPSTSITLLPSMSTGSFSQAPAPAASVSLWRSKSTRSPLLLMRWSFRDKKRLEGIVHRFQDRNRMVREDIEALTAESRLGIDPGHLHHLQSDDSSKELGYDTNATLTLTLQHAQADTRSLELTSPAWLDYFRKATSSSIEGNFSIIKAGNIPFLQEDRAYSSPPQMPHGVDPRTQDRVNLLAKLLEQRKGQVFRIPHCIGWKFDALSRRIGFVFEIPNGVAAQPVSLIKLLNDEDANIQLGKKFKLAHGLAECISKLHMVKWVHESFRSENVLFFPIIHSGAGEPVNIEQRIDYSQPWVLGFELSRPENDFSSGFIDIDAARDVYRHPERQGQPQKPFQKTHDIYALGVVLLEIGLWEPAITFEKNHFQFARNPHDIQAILVKRAEKHLEARVGEKYKNVVLKCLKADFGSTDSKPESGSMLQNFRTEVVDVLKKAADNV